MPKNYDVVFAKAAIHNKLIPIEQAKELLKSLPEGRSFAAMAIEKNYIPREKVERLIKKINDVSSAKHPTIPRMTGVHARKKSASQMLPSVPKTAVEPVRKKGPTRELPATRRRGESRRRPVPAPKKSSSKLPLIIGGAVILLVGLIIGIIAAVSGGEDPVPENPVADQPIEKPDPKPEPKPEPKPDPKPEPKPEPEPEPAPEPDDERSRFYQKLEEDAESAREFLAESWTELKEKRSVAEDKAATFRKRFEGRSMTVELLSGRSYPDARLIDFSFEALRIKTGSEFDVSWSLISPSTARKVAKIVYSEEPFERGRFLTSQKLWKEAKQSFEEAVEKDEDLEYEVEEIVPILDKLIAGEGAFHGSAIRVGRTGLELTYDFSAEDQGGDFLGQPVKISGGKMVCEKGRYQLTQMSFTSEMEVQMSLTLTGRIFFVIRDMRLELGEELVLRNMKDKNEVAKGKGLVEGKETAVHLRIKNNKVDLSLEGKKILSGSLPLEEGEDPNLGPFRFEVKKGTATFSSPLKVRGEFSENELRKRFAEVEILVRRATAGDLDDIAMEMEQAREERVLGTHSEERVNTCADDLYFTGPLLASGDLATYSAIKSGLASFLQTRMEEGLVEKMDTLLKKYPDLPGLHYYRGLFHLEIGKRDEAKKNFDKALRLFPEFFECLSDRARLHLYDHQYDEGLVLVEKALKMRPDYASAYALRGVLSYAKDQIRSEAVRDDLDIAQTLDPDDNEIVSHQRAIETESKGPRYLGCIYSYESKHYRVVTDISESAAEEYANRLEAAFGWYREYLKKVYPGEPDRKPRVAVFNTREAYYTYNELIATTRNENTLGIFRQWYNELVLFEDAEIDNSLTTLYHEAFHHFMSISSKHTMPYWFNEGMADYMGGMTIEDGKILRKARVLNNECRLIKLRLKQGYYLPFEEIMTQSPAEFYSGPVGFKYSQSWSMCHFFHHAEGGKYRPMIIRYFLLLHSGKHRQEAFDEVFRGKTGSLERAWKKYVKGLKLEKKGS